MSNIEDRWIELQLYQFLQDLQIKHRNQLTVLDFIEALSVYGKFSSTKAQKLVLEVMDWPHYRPSKEEMAILAYKADADILDITRASGLERHTIYRAVREEKQNPRMYIPRLSQEKSVLAKQIVDAINDIRKVGIYGKRTIRETPSNAQVNWSRGVYSEPL